MNQLANRSLFSILILAILLSFLAISPVFAHELTPTKASPAEREILAKSPQEVRLIFSEEITEGGSTLQVFDESGKQVDQANGGVDLNDAQHKMLVVRIPDLQQGIYLVKWKVTLTDGDVSRGQYYFGIGNVILPTPKVTVLTPEPITKTDPPAVLWLGVGAISLLVFVLAAYFIRKSSSKR
jgi:copper transport protein